MDTKIKAWLFKKLYYKHCNKLQENVIISSVWKTKASSISSIPVNTHTNAWIMYSCEN